MIRTNVKVNLSSFWLLAKRNKPEALIKAQELGAALQEYLSVSQSARVAARICGVSRRELYGLMEQGEET